jgi:hypothetical protein
VPEEVAPGASERHVPQASRGICEDGGVGGSIVVRVMLDYRTLPFLSSQNPYLESLRPERAAAPEGSQGNDIEFVAYGWSRAPFSEAGTSTWPLSDDLFQHAVGSREPFWTAVRRNDSTFRVYFTNDRGGIYAIGYPVLTTFGHLVNLAELLVLVGALYALMVVGASVFSIVAAATPASGRELLREFRASFYRKLFLASVAVAVVPVALLAVGVRTYFARQAGADLEPPRDGPSPSVFELASLRSAGRRRWRPRRPGAGARDRAIGRMSALRSHHLRSLERSAILFASGCCAYAGRVRIVRHPPSGCRCLSASSSWPTFQAASRPRRRAGGCDGIVTVRFCSRSSSSGRSTSSIGRSSSARSS